LLQTNKYIKGLNALRAMSIGFVLLNHLGVDVLIPDNYYFRINFWSLISGETGVHIFFVLSGFLITKILWNHFEETGHINLKRFFIRRFLRLMPPLIIFYTLVFVLLMLDFIEYDLQALLFSFFYIYNYVPLLHYRSEFAHLWSLSVEEQFYLIWPLSILLFRKRERIVSLILIFIFLSIFCMALFPEFVFQSEFRPKRWFLPAAGFIAIGAWLSLYQIKNHLKLIQFFAKERFVFWVSILLYLTPLFVPTIFVEIMAFAQACGVALFILWIYYNQESLFVGFLEWKPIVYIGRISYGIYVFQGLFLLTGPGSEIGYQKFPTNIILTFGLAIASYHLIEMPIMKMKSKF
jgi:peptidoglycan/LPS O-acetylase OafA/YrhL